MLSSCNMEQTPCEDADTDICTQTEHAVDLNFVSKPQSELVIIHSFMSHDTSGAPVISNRVLIYA